MNAELGLLLCDRTRLKLFPMIGELGRRLGSLPAVQSFTGVCFRRQIASELALVVPDDASADVRLGPLAERLIWFLHSRALAAGRTRLTLADSELASALWPSDRPAHWRADLSWILHSLARLHLFDRCAEIEQLGPATALLTSATDLRGEPERNRCPEGCPARGTGAHHHYFVQLGPAFLGRLQDCTAHTGEDGEPVYDFYNRRVLRRLGRQNCLTSVFLPAKLGCPARTASLSPGQHRILQGLVQEITRQPGRKSHQPVRHQVITGGMVADFRGLSLEFCPLLPALEELVVFGGNGVRRGLGYQIHSSGGWCAKTGFEPHRPAEFLQQLQGLANLLGLYLVGATSLSGGWLSGAQLQGLASSANSRGQLQRVHLRVYTRSDCWARWSEYFAWPPASPSSNCALEALRLRLSTSGLSQGEWAQRLQVDPSQLSRYLSGQRRLPPEILQRVETWLAAHLGGQEAKNSARN